MNLKIGAASVALGLIVALGGVAGAYAQEAVIEAKDKDALFTSKDPVLHANKQIVYHIVKDLLEAGQWGEADKYLSERYLQHNPNVPSAVPAWLASSRRF